MKLAAVRIFVRRLDEAAAFYEQKLGLRPRARAAAFAVFDAQSCDLVLEEVPADAPPEEQALVGRFTGLSFAVHDIADRCRWLAAQGVPFTGPPEKQGWGGTLATLRDPAGNELQLVEYPEAG